MSEVNIKRNSEALDLILIELIDQIKITEEKAKNMPFREAITLFLKAFVIREKYRNNDDFSEPQINFIVGMDDKDI